MGKANPHAHRLDSDLSYYILQVLRKDDLLHNTIEDFLPSAIEKKSYYEHEILDTFWELATLGYIDNHKKGQDDYYKLSDKGLKLYLQLHRNYLPHNLEDIILKELHKLTLNKTSIPVKKRIKEIDVVYTDNEYNEAIAILTGNKLAEIDEDCPIGSDDCLIITNDLGLKAINSGKFVKSFIADMSNRHQNPPVLIARDVIIGDGNIHSSPNAQSQIAEKIINNPKSKRDTPIAKKIIIGVVIAVIGTVIAWWVIEQIS